MSESTWIVFDNPYGGLGLRAQSAQTAKARIDGLLAACAVGVAWSSSELSVSEPCTMALVEAVYGSTDDLGCSRGGRMLDESASDLAARHGHEPDALVAEAWQSLGEPTGLDYRSFQGASHALWTWRAEGPAAEDAADRWWPFLVRHQALELDEWTPRVAFDTDQSFVLRRPGGTPAPDGFPRSGLRANLRRRHASAFLDLVFPYASVTDDFVADYEAVCEALGLRLPPGRFRLDAPTRSGGRKRAKLRDSFG